MKGSVVVRSVIVLAIGAVLCAAWVDAQPVLDQNQPSGVVNMATFSQTGLAQSFQPGLGLCSGAGILLISGYGTTDTVTIQLWTALPNVGGATMLAQGSAQGTAGQWVDVYWTPVPVTIGQTYYLVFTGNTTLAIAGDTNNPYPNGNVYANAGYGSFPTFDYAFRTWGENAAVPLLGSSGLVILVMMMLVAGVVALRRLA